MLRRYAEILKLRMPMKEVSELECEIAKESSCVCVSNINMCVQIVCFFLLKSVFPEFPYSPEEITKLMVLKRINQCVEK